MAENNNQILTGKQTVVNTIQKNQKQDNELDSQNNQSHSPSAIFSNQFENENLEKDDSEEELGGKKKNFLEVMKNEGLKENQLKKLAEIPVKEKSDYFFFVLVASTAIGGPIGFVLASLACEKLGIQPGGVIEDSRSFNSDAITTPIIKTLNEIVLAINKHDGYDKSLAPALITGFKSAVDLVKEKFNPKNKTKPTSAKCLGEAKNLKHSAEVEKQKNIQGQGNLNQRNS